MRHDHEIELGEIDAFRLRVSREDVTVIAGVEKDAFSANLDQGGIPPVRLHLCIATKGVVQDRDDGHCRIDGGGRCFGGLPGDETKK
jgi:hypothetical protein